VAPVRGGTGVEQFQRRRARSWTRSGRGASGGGEGAVGSWNLGGVERSRRIPARSAGRASVARGGRRGNMRGNGVSVGLYRSAWLRRREGEGEWSRDQAQDGGCVAAARHRRPDVAERGTASGGGAGSGRGSIVTRG
jgi:hypothetical protein